MLDVFWSEHRPTSPAFSRQYMSAILYHSEEQRRLAEESRDHLSVIVGQIHTRITPFERFYMAEDYHQKYRLRGAKAFFAEMHAIYPDEGDFRDSTASARINGYLDGHGSCEELTNEVDGFGLGSPAREQLVRSVCGTKR